MVMTAPPSKPLLGYRGEGISKNPALQFVPSHIATCPAVARESEGTLRLGLEQVDCGVHSPCPASMQGHKQVAHTSSM